jgi:hypothetical protein
MTVEYEIDGAVGVVTLAKPPHNLLDDALLEDLMTTYENVVAEGARAILPRSSMRHFCVGAALQTFALGSGSANAWARFCRYSASRPKVVALRRNTKRTSYLRRTGMRRVLVSTFATVLAGLYLSGPALAQPANPPTPTTRILAIGTVNPGVDPAAVKSILPTEVRETVKLYLDGKIDQWFSLQGRGGVAFILNLTDPAAAHDMLERLPLGQAHLMSFELIPLAPLNPLRQLPGMSPRQP